MQIQRDLREQYLVAYSPSNKTRDGSYRRIEIQLVNPTLRQQNLKLNYRSGIRQDWCCEPGRQAGPGQVKRPVNRRKSSEISAVTEFR